MTHQLSWTTLSGLRGLSWGEFRAVPTEQPDNERRVAVESASEAELEKPIAELERHFADVRFSNNATAFETVKALVLERSARNP